MNGYDAGNTLATMASLLKVVGVIILSIAALIWALGFIQAIDPAMKGFAIRMIMVGVFVLTAGMAFAVIGGAGGGRRWQ